MPVRMEIQVLDDGERFGRYVYILVLIVAGALVVARIRRPDKHRFR